MAVVAHSVKGRVRPGPADLGMFLVGLIWGVNYPLVKSTLETMDPLVFNGIRMVLAGLALPVLAFLLGVDLRVPRRDLWKLLGWGVLGNTGYQLCFIYGIEYTTASNVSLVLSTSPVLVALLGAVVGVERISGRGWVGIVAASLGIALLVTGKNGGLAFGGPGTVGDLLILTGAACWAVYTLGIKSLIARLGPTRVAVYSLVLGVWPLVLMAIPKVQMQAWERVGWMDIGAVSFSGVFAIALSYVIWNIGVKHLGAARTAVYVTVPPVVTALIGWLWLGERFAAVQWLGAGLTLCGVVLTRLSTTTKPTEEQVGEE